MFIYISFIYFSSFKLMELLYLPFSVVVADLLQGDVPAPGLDLVAAWSEAEPFLHQLSSGGVHLPLTGKHFYPSFIINLLELFFVWLYQEMKKKSRILYFFVPVYTKRLVNFKKRNKLSIIFLAILTSFLRVSFES